MWIMREGSLECELLMFCCTWTESKCAHLLIVWKRSTKQRRMTRERKPKLWKSLVFTCWHSHTYSFIAGCRAYINIRVGHKSRACKADFIFPGSNLLPLHVIWCFSLLLRRMGNILWHRDVVKDVVICAQRWMFQLFDLVLILCLRSTLEL